MIKIKLVDVVGFEPTSVKHPPALQAGELPVVHHILNLQGLGSWENDSPTPHLWLLSFWESTPVNLRTVTYISSVLSHSWCPSSTFKSFESSRLKDSNLRGKRLCQCQLLESLGGLTGDRNQITSCVQELSKDFLRLPVFPKNPELEYWESQKKWIRWVGFDYTSFLR